MSDPEQDPTERLRAELQAVRAERDLLRARLDAAAVPLGAAPAGLLATQEAGRPCPESEATLRAIIECAADAIYLKDLAGRYLLINPAGAAFFGRPAHEVVGKTDGELLGPETGRLLREEDREVVSLGDMRVFEETMRPVGAPGEVVYLTTKVPFRAADGQVVGTIGISRDISDRKRLEMALRRAKDELEFRVDERTADLAHAIDALQVALRELADLYDHAPCGYHSLDEDGRILRINDTELAWLGYARADVVGKLTVFDLLTPPSAELVRRLYPTFRARGAIRDLEVGLVRRDGTIMTALLSATVSRDAAGRFLKSRSTLFDITDRKQAEAELRRSEASLANAQRIAHLGSWELELESEVLRWSDEVYRIFGVAPGTGLTYEAFLAAVHPDDRATVERAVDEALADRKPYGVDHRIVRSDGGVRHVHEQAEVVCDEAGRPTGMAGTVQDVTEYKRAQAEIARREAELRQAQELDRLKDVFINSVSHDLRAPIMSILGYSEFLEEGIGGSLTLEQHGFVAQIEKNARRLEFMVNDLLDLARMGAGTFELEKADEDVRTYLRDVADSMRPLLDEAGLDLELGLPEGDLRAKVDSRRIERVVANLLTNAIKFTPAGGRIRLDARVEGGLLRCEVTDTGIGIASQDVPKLFRRFSRLEAGKRNGGTGLGLSISKAIVEAHGGSIGVRSVQGAGSTFWFVLPLDA